jgi:hypothetical protein
MNINMRTVLNVDIPVMYMGVSVHMCVKCVIGPSLKRAALYHIDTYTVLAAVILVMCVIRPSL